MPDQNATSAIMTAGMALLLNNLGSIETEIFITTVKRNNFDYTEWRRDNLFSGMTLDEILDHAGEYERIHGAPKIRGSEPNI
jgi:hypothetical protein